MVKTIVTGAAGFIGSHLCEKLIDIGFNVIGIDRFSDFYSKEIKLRNIEGLLCKNNFTLIKKNILELENIDEDTEFIFHTAAQPGVRTSWGKEFEIYVRDNVLATQHLLELSKDLSQLKNFVYSSSSSVYGDTDEFPTSEIALPMPKSPYGVTKLAGEYLCNLYFKNYGIPVISLRYFTVFGPRQRPDMAFHRFIKNILSNDKIIIYGDGNQSRDFTYFSDIVEANIKAAFSDCKGEVFNIGGGNHSTINQIINMLKRLLKRKVKIGYTEKAIGDVKNTEADMKKTEKLLNFRPKISLEEGLEKEISWIKELYNLV